MQKNIFHIITGLQDGGAEGVLFRLCRYNHCKNTRHTVISLTGDGKYQQPLAECGVKVHLLSMKSPGGFLSGLFKLYRLLKKEQPDVVQTWMYHADFIGGCLAKLAGINTIIWGIRHSDFGQEIKPSTRAFIWLSAKLSYWIPNTIVSCANNAKQFHIDYGYCPEKFKVIPNGYNISQYYPDKDLRTHAQQQWQIDPSHLVLGTVARYNPQKGHSVLLAGLALLAQKDIAFTCLLVGKGCDPDNPELVQQIKALKLEQQIKLLGQQNPVNKPINAMDIHILPSVSGEGFPNVVAESMCCGVPAIVTNVGDAADIAANQGIVVEKNNPGALAKAIEQFAQEKSTAAWEHRKEQSRAFIMQHFSIEKMITRFNALY